MTTPYSQCEGRSGAQIPFRQVRAVYDDQTVRVYQAYSDHIADEALEHRTFRSPSFNMERMTWIKPSFLWMACRAGWGKKDKKQKRILAIDITREGFEWALGHSRPSNGGVGPKGGGEASESTRSNCVLIQWDPERDLFCNPQHQRAIQVGIRGEAVGRYVHDWIVKISDVTRLADEIHGCLVRGDMSAVVHLLPKERKYPLNPEITARLAMVALDGCCEVGAETSRALARQRAKSI